jgi:PhzF family phenazine biosynthesis protein
LTIAKEMRHSETAFVTRDAASGKNNVFHLCWFTPTVEVNLCGHGTLATASVLFNEEKIDATELIFHTKSGDLIVSRDASGLLTMDFPKGSPKKVQLPQDVKEAVASAISLDHNRITDVQFCATTKKLFVEYNSITDIEAAKVPTFESLLSIKFPSDMDVRGVCIVSPFFPEGHAHEDCDFASRYFSPFVSSSPVISNP